MVQRKNFLLMLMVMGLGLENVMVKEMELEMAPQATFLDIVTAESVSLYQKQSDLGRGSSQENQ